MKNKNFFQDENQSPAAATLSLVTVKLDGGATEFIPSPGEMTIMDYFSGRIASARAMKLIPERAGSTKRQEFHHETRDLRYNSYAHYGLNE